MNLTRYRTHILALVGIAAVFTAVMGFLHTPAGHRAWGRVTGQASCPFGAGQSPHQRDVARAQSDKMLQGEVPAQTKMALGFKFDSTTRSDVDAWAKSVDGKCAMAQTSGELECAIPKLNKIPGIAAADTSGTLFFDFDSQQRLKKVSAQVLLPDVQAATAAMQSLVTEVSAQVGGEAFLKGEITPTYLADTFKQTVADYHRKDFYARAKVTNLGARFVFEQSYQTLTF